MKIVLGVLAAIGVVVITLAAIGVIVKLLPIPIELIEVNKDFKK